MGWPSSDTAGFQAIRFRRVEKDDHSLLIKRMWWSMLEGLLQEGSRFSEVNEGLDINLPWREKAPSSTAVSNSHSNLEKTEEQTWSTNRTEGGFASVSPCP